MSCTWDFREILWHVFKVREKSSKDLFAVDSIISSIHNRHASCIYKSQNPRPDITQPQHSHSLISTSSSPNLRRDSQSLLSQHVITLDRYLLRIGPPTTTLPWILQLPAVPAPPRGYRTFPVFGSARRVHRLHATFPAFAP